MYPVRGLDTWHGFRAALDSELGPPFYNVVLVTEFSDWVKGGKSRGDKMIGKPL